AEAYRRSGKWTEALRLNEKALALYDKHSPDSYKRAYVLNAMALVYNTTDDPKLRDPDKAIASYLQALAVYEKTKGKRHPLVISPHQNLVSVYFTKGDYSSALEHAQIYYEIALAYYGPDSPKARDGMESLSASYYNLKRYREALEWSQRAVELNKKLEGPDSPEMRYSMENYGRSLVGLGRGLEAIPVLERTLKWFEAEKAPDPEDLGEVRFALARALRDTKRDPERAVALATRARDDFTTAKATKKADEVDKWLRAPSSGAGKRRGALGSRDY
ncbi:MAG TPA: tetratricopeptide repeat protein, partial [Myxococcales bacterium]|nr:tetratricopeptide repeat protein [Myxococcales bacterium]